MGIKTSSSDAFLMLLVRSIKDADFRELLLQQDAMIITVPHLYINHNRAI